ncbi:MAG TPA: hypothetical protein PKV98_16290 [Burkholderiaceae bacterium]|nr:hypothetical protein [Burkholderiaceae bacterium]
MKKSRLILQALAEAPDGLVTSSVASAIGEAEYTKNVSALLTYATNCGRVLKVSGGAGAGEATWRITQAGLDYLSELLAEAAEDTAAPAAAPTPSAPRIKRGRRKPQARVMNDAIARGPITAPPRRMAPHSNGQRYYGSLPPIESGIPLPEAQRPPNKYRAAALAMKRGDRIVFHVKTQAHALAVQLRKEGFTAATRQLHDGRYATWRVK